MSMALILSNPPRSRRGRKHMRRARDSKGRFLNRRRARVATRRRRNAYIMPNVRRRRRHGGRRRSYHRRRHHNPALLRGLKLPNFGDVFTTVAGGLGSKFLGRTVFPQGAAMFGGWGGALTTLGAGLALGFLLPMIGMRRFAGAAVSGAATIAALDAVKLTPLGAQLGSYVAPAGDTPVLGAYPEGFMDPSLGAGDMNYPGGFEAEPYDGMYS